MTKKLMPIVPPLIFAAAGFACGIAFCELFSATDSFVASLFMLLIAMYISLFISGAIHEAGHLVCGLISGYSFLSYRLGGLMLIKGEKGLKLKRFSLAGTGGQCLMLPPETQIENIPYRLYNLGGSLFNLISGLGFLAVSILTENPLPLILAIVSLASALINGIPLSTRLIDNDGMNILSLGRSISARTAFVNQLRIAGAQTKGVRIHEMPREWFITDSMSESPLCASVSFFSAERTLDSLDFEGAVKQLEPLKNEPMLLGVYKPLLICDLAVCKYFLGEKEEADRLLNDKNQQKLLRNLKNNISVVRTELVAAIANGSSESELSSLEKKLDQLSTSYPYRGDAEGELELVNAAKAQLRK